MFFRQLRNELIKLFGKKRTYIGFGMFLLAQNGMLLGFHFGKGWRSFMERTLAGNGYLVEDYISALTVALIMLIPQVFILMPLYTGLIGGDLVAKEAEDGTLRMILSRPISRWRLLMVKWCAGVVFSIVQVLALGLMAVLFARLWFPWRGMFVFVNDPEDVFRILSAAEGLKFYAISHFFLAINASTMMTIAFMFGCFNMKPAAATILAVSLLLINFVTDHIPALADWRPYLLLHQFRVWITIYAEPLDWSRVITALCVLLAFNVTCLVIGG
ncbi:MAG TPA: ABC transporter permease subunit, partial [Candidatus Acidoferrum sp.]|nr:ABC transporter permease subunit [Candidatus Acidoferrum sp.]